MRPVGVYTKFIDNVISSGCDMGSKFEKYQYIGNDGNTHNYAIYTYVNVVCNTFMIINDSASAYLSVMNCYVFSGNAENVTFASSNNIIDTCLPDHAEVFQINGDCTIILPNSKYGFTEDKII